jgi:hypothetical protein
MNPVMPKCKLQSQREGLELLEHRAIQAADVKTTVSSLGKAAQRNGQEENLIQSHVVEMDLVDLGQVSRDGLRVGNETSRWSF